MFPRTSLRFTLCFALALATAPALAQYTRDNAATKKIDEAINQHYFATDFDKAEAVLLGTLKACQDKCRPQTLAKAWVYIGIVRGSGRSDQQGAAQAFQNAVQLDRQVQLDAAIATPETVTTFNMVAGSAATTPPPAYPTTPTPPVGPVAPVAPPAGPAAGLACTPTPSETLSRAPIPVSCLGAADIAVMEIRYRTVHGDRWSAARMQRSGQYFQGQIPCADTGDVGPLSAYVVAKDGAGTVIDSWGSEAAPQQYTIVNQTGAPPLALPGQAPPARCEDVECPPDFPGCQSGPPGGAGNVGWGGVCIQTAQCEAGLTCLDADGDGEKTCENAPPCDSDEDCPSGACTSGKCEVDESEPEQDGPASGPGKKLWVGLHVAQDWVSLSAAEEICDPTTQPQFACRFGGDPYPSLDGQFFPEPGARGAVASGFAIGTTRILLSLNYAITANLTLGVRGGYALNGTPTYDGDAQPFLPIHVEAEAAYWFGRNPHGRTGLRPYVKLGGGMAQIDGRFVVNVLDCERDAMQPPPNFCKKTSEEPLAVDAYQKLGRGFVAGGAGLVFAFGESAGFDLKLQALYAFPDSGLVIEPSLGFVVGM